MKKELYFSSKLRRNRQITLPQPNFKMLCLKNNWSERDLSGCILELEIKAIHINNKMYRLSSMDEKPNTE